MGSLALFVGLDYSDKAVQVCLLDRDGRQVANRWCQNDWRLIVEFAQRHGTVVEAAIESCTGAANLAEELATRAGWSVHLAHPGYVARMKQTPDKTDYQDARLLADLVRVGYLPRVWLAPEPGHLGCNARYKMGLPLPLETPTWARPLADARI